jgi:chlorite dismutase
MSVRPGSSNGRPIPTTAPAAGAHDRAAQLTRRQYVRFAFYRVDPAWRRLPADEQAAHKRELAETIRQFNRRMLLRPYTLMGTRADAELLLWQIAESPQPFQEIAAAILRTRMGAYLHLAYSYLSQTKRSIYEIRVGDVDESEERLVIDPSEAKYLFVYPFVKTRDWYQLSLPTRQGMIDEHVQVGRKYPSVRLNTTYSFGLDDYEFVVAFETDEPSDFLDLVQDLRETEASRYTKLDIPLFFCINTSLEAALDAMGGPPVAEAAAPDVAQEAWVELGPLSEFPAGETRTVYLEGRMVGVFNIDGALYAINNRCTHARGPLSEGTVDPAACTVVCPWHYGKFDLRTGQAVDGLVKQPVETYAVEIRDGVVFVGTRVTMPS